MKIYLDSDYKCHTQPGDGLREVETDFFSGKSPRFIEGYRYVPEGETWQREDGEKFHGEMICPAELDLVLETAQSLYKEYSEQIAELEQRFQRLRDCLDGLATVPGLEQLQDFLLSIREIMEDD